jgi:hypothetical protein
MKKHSFLSLVGIGILSVSIVAIMLIAGIVVYQVVKRGGLLLFG